MTADRSRGNGRRAVVFEYTQTGQLSEVVDALVAPMAAAGWRIRRVAVRPATPFPFPWPVLRFFGVFPACVDQDAIIELADDEFHSAPDELVIFAYQVWYLAPSLPARSLLAKHSELFTGREVLSVVACRNMWYSAAAEVQGRLADVGARAVGTVAAIDTRAQAITFVTTLRWLLTGPRDGTVFGRAGVGADELERIGVLGARLADADDRAAVLRKSDAAPVVPVLAAADLLAGKAFRRFGAVIRRAAGRGPLAWAGAMTGFVATLGVAIATGLPALAVARLLFGSHFDRWVTARVAATLDPTARPAVTA
ncbi:hypothetical protein LTV02_00365 [Nocardia yamanashiensis]|uniref:hypothetical protein n=1 Tax=Nocardia yamanashiensis TaxID=209247 RepID=UPI001E4E9B95|nr:hypothetical protein [Nocardia yamanashiensis]UGT41920.1 hypothetical protein LTV02_00365 [Nocardia yamanashiensis]